MPELWNGIVTNIDITVASMRSNRADINFEQVLSVFRIEPETATIEPIGNGLINSTFHVRSNGKSILLQRLNGNVFDSPREIVQNYNKIYSHLEKQSCAYIPAPIRTSDNNLCMTDHMGHCWRATKFVEGSYTQDVARSPEDAWAAAYCFGDLTHCLDGFDATQLKVIIPQFHDLAFRYQQFAEAVRKDKAGRKKDCMEEITDLEKRRSLVDFFSGLILDPSYRQRVMHHDAKISNVLFNKETSKLICPVDLDTVMPGYYFSDLGDMIRSMCCSYDENSTDYSSINIRSDYYNAIIDGYMNRMETHLTGEEKKHLHFSGPIMVFMQSLRFMTDHLNGDIYYRLDHPGQNYERGKNQLTLLKRLEEFLATKKAGA